MDPQKTAQHKQYLTGDMAFFLRVVFAIALIGPALTQDAGTSTELERQPRSLRKRLCKKHGICGNQGYGGQGFQQGYQQGYQGHQQGYQGYPPAINIGISQSQSSASAGGGGYSNGYYPNNYQYNGAPNQGYGGYHGNGYGGYPNQRPGYFGNGQGGYNNQFNGNYYGPGGGNGGGYGFQGPFQGGYHDEAQSQDEPGHGDGNDEHNQYGQDDQGNYNDYNHGPHGSQGTQGPQGSYEHGEDYALAGSFAFAGRKNQ